MASLDDIVNVQIRLNTSYVSTADFGTILIGGVMPSGKLVESYKSYDEAVADGIDDADTLACIRAAFSQDPKPVRVKVANILGGKSEAEMMRILKLDDAWYALVPATEDRNTIMAFAAIIETMKKIMIVSGHGYSDFTSLNDALKDKRYLRTAAIMAGSKFASAAWAAKCLSYSAGQESWALKKLSATEPAKLNDIQRQQIINSNGSTLEWYSNDVAVTAGGKTAGGEWIDTVRGRDWLENYIQTEMTALMINTDGKIPSCLNEGVYRGLIAEDTENDAGDVIKGYGINVRWANEISANTKASRVYDGLSFWAKLSGAIHVVKITGSFVN